MTCERCRAEGVSLLRRGGGGSARQHGTATHSTTCATQHKMRHFTTVQIMHAFRRSDADIVVLLDALMTVRHSTEKALGVCTTCHVHAPQQLAPQAACATCATGSMRHRHPRDASAAHGCAGSRAGRAVGGGNCEECKPRGGAAWGSAPRRRA